MIKFGKRILRISFFVVLVLIFGQLIRWEGRSLSDQIRSKMRELTASSDQGIRKLEESTKKLIGSLGQSARQGVKTLGNRFDHQKNNAQQNAQQNIREATDQEKESLESIIEE